MAYLPKLNPTVGGGLGGLPERTTAPEAPPTPAVEPFTDYLDVFDDGSQPRHIWPLSNGLVLIRLGTAFSLYDPEAKEVLDSVTAVAAETGQSALYEFDGYVVLSSEEYSNSEIRRMGFVKLFIDYENNTLSFLSTNILQTAVFASGRVPTAVVMENGIIACQNGDRIQFLDTVNWTFVLQQTGYSHSTGNNTLLVYSAPYLYRLNGRSAQVILFDYSSNTVTNVFNSTNFAIPADFPYRSPTSPFQIAVFGVAHPNGGVQLFIDGVTTDTYRTALLTYDGSTLSFQPAETIALPDAIAKTSFGYRRLIVLSSPWRAAPCSITIDKKYFFCREANSISQFGGFRVNLIFKLDPVLNIYVLHNIDGLVAPLATVATRTSPNVGTTSQFSNQRTCHTPYGYVNCSVYDVGSSNKVQYAKGVFYGQD